MAEEKVLNEVKKQCETALATEAAKTLAVMYFQYLEQIKSITRNDGVNAALIEEQHLIEQVLDRGLGMSQTEIHDLLNSYDIYNNQLLK